MSGVTETRSKKPLWGEKHDLCSSFGCAHAATSRTGVTLETAQDCLKFSCCIYTHTHTSKRYFCLSCPGL